MPTAMAAAMARGEPSASAGSMRWSTMPAIAVFAPLLETSDADWNRILAVNLTGPFLCTKAAAP